MTDKKYVRVKELADVYGVTQNTVRTWCKKGWVPYMRIGTGGFRFDLAEVEAAMKKHAEEIEASKLATPADKDL